MMLSSVPTSASHWASSAGEGSRFAVGSKPSGSRVMWSIRVITSLSHPEPASRLSHRTRQKSCKHMKLYLECKKIICPVFTNIYWYSYTVLYTDMFSDINFCLIVNNKPPLKSCSLFNWANSCFMLCVNQTLLLHICPVLFWAAEKEETKTSWDPTSCGANICRPNHFLLYTKM